MCFGHRGHDLGLEQVTQYICAYVRLKGVNGRLKKRWLPNFSVVSIFISLPWRLIFLSSAYAVLSRVSPYSCVQTSCILCSGEMIIGSAVTGVLSILQHQQTQTNIVCVCRYYNIDNIPVAAFPVGVISLVPLQVSVPLERMQHGLEQAPATLCLRASWSSLIYIWCSRHVTKKVLTSTNVHEILFQFKLCWTNRNRWCCYPSIKISVTLMLCCLCWW